MGVRFTKKRINEIRLSYEFRQTKCLEPANQKHQYLLSQDMEWYSIDLASRVAYFETNCEQPGKTPCCFFQLPFNDFFQAYKYTEELFINNRKKFHPTWRCYFTQFDGIFVYELEDKNGKFIKGNNYIRTIIPDPPKILADLPPDVHKAFSFTKYDGFFHENETIKIEDLKFFHNPEWPLDS